jgi:hypothetical protein
LPARVPGIRELIRDRVVHETALRGSGTLGLLREGRRESDASHPRHRSPDDGPHRGAGYRRGPAHTQSATTADTDLGKLALCTSAADGSLCKVADGYEYPCVCIDTRGELSRAAPLCGPSSCDCSPNGCDANIRRAAISSSLRLVAGQLEGRIGYVAIAPISITFVRELP